MSDYSNYSGKAFDSLIKGKQEDIARAQERYNKLNSFQKALSGKAMEKQISLEQAELEKMRTAQQADTAKRKQAAGVMSTDDYNTLQQLKERQKAGQVTSSDELKTLKDLQDRFDLQDDKIKQGLSAQQQATYPNGPGTGKGTPQNTPAPGAPAPGAPAPGAPAPGAPAPGAKKKGSGVWGGVLGNIAADMEAQRDNAGLRHEMLAQDEAMTQVKKQAHMQENQGKVWQGRANVDERTVAAQDAAAAGASAAQQTKQQLQANAGGGAAALAGAKAANAAQAATHPQALQKAREQRIDYQQKAQDMENASYNTQNNVAVMEGNRAKQEQNYDNTLRKSAAQKKYANTLSPEQQKAYNSMTQEQQNEYILEQQKKAPQMGVPSDKRIKRYEPSRTERLVARYVGRRVC